MELTDEMRFEIAAVLDISPAEVYELAYVTADQIKEIKAHDTGGEEFYQVILSDNDRMEIECSRYGTYCYRIKVLTDNKQLKIPLDNFHLFMVRRKNRERGQEAKNQQ